MTVDINGQEIKEAKCRRAETATLREAEQKNSRAISVAQTIASAARGFESLADVREITPAGTRFAPDRRFDPYAGERLFEFEQRQRRMQSGMFSASVVHLALHEQRQQNVAIPLLIPGNYRR